MRNTNARIGVVGAALAGAALLIAPSAHADPFVAHGYSDDDLRDELRLLWNERATWTRGLVISTTSGLGDAGEARAKLDHNAGEIARVLSVHDVGAVPDDLLGALETETSSVEEVAAAVKDGMPDRIAAGRAAARASADAVAVALGDGESDGASDFSTPVRAYMDATLSEMGARFRGDWDADIAAYDRAADRAFAIADASAADAAARAPDSFAPSYRTREEQELHLAMRELWSDHVDWARFAIIDQVAGLPGTPRTTLRLLANQRQLGDELRPYYGDDAGQMWTNLLRHHVLVTAAVVDAAASHDTDRLRTARTVWYTNAYTMDVFLASANPDWSIAAMRDMVKTHLDQTSIEAASRVAEDWAGDAAAYDAVLANALELADTLSAGIAAQGLLGPG